MILNDENPWERHHIRTVYNSTNYDVAYPSTICAWAGSNIERMSQSKLAGN